MLFFFILRNCGFLFLVFFIFSALRFYQDGALNLLPRFFPNNRSLFFDSLELITRPAKNRGKLDLPPAIQIWNNILDLFLKDYPGERGGVLDLRAKGGQLFLNKFLNTAYYF